jgi:hypothetical protein
MERKIEAFKCFNEVEIATTGYPSSYISEITGISCGNNESNLEFVPAGIIEENYQYNEEFDSPYDKKYDFAYDEDYYDLDDVEYYYPYDGELEDERQENYERKNLGDYNLVEYYKDDDHENDNEDDEEYLDYEEYMDLDDYENLNDYQDEYELDYD